MGECAALACDLREAPAKRRSRRGNVEAHDDVAGGQRRRVGIMDEIGDTLHPHAAAAADADARIERDQTARPVRGRVGECHAAADGAVVAHRTIRDLTGDAPHQAAENIRHLAVFDGRMRGQRTEPKAVRGFGHNLEIVEPADVDQQIDQRDPEPQHRHQRLTAGDGSGGRAAPAERDACLGDRFRPDIFERRGLHGAGPDVAEFLARRARSIASETRRGVSGVSLKLAPMLRNASDTALAMAAGGAMAPPSPRPLTPYSVACAGCTRCAMRTVGTSGAQGTMYSPNDVASGWPISSYGISS